MLMATSTDSWNNRVQSVTENLLSKRRERIRIKKEKAKAKNPVLDWIEAFIWAAVVVLIINQYFFQAYQIPTPSMVETLKVKDRIFVNKLIYGPELVPGNFKVDGFRKPARNEVIIFESPTYLSRGPVFDVAQRIIYMITFSLVDIDKDQYGNPKAHFLIKRAMAHEGDSIKIADGEVQLKPAGFDTWMPETDLKEITGKTYQTRRLINADEYDGIRAAAFIDAYDDTGIQPNSVDSEIASASNSQYTDMYSWSGYRYQALYEVNPHLHQYGGAWRKISTGWFIPEGWIFPMGDNRDNSRDARYFGPVSLDKVLGRAIFKYWPAGRIGVIR